MPRFLIQKEAFLKCDQEGRFIVLEEIDYEKIKSALLTRNSPELALG